MTETNSFVAVPRKVNGLAVAGFILSTTFVFSGIGIILSAISLEQFRGYRGKEVIGKKLAFSGIIIGIVTSFIFYITYLLVILNASLISDIGRTMRYFL